MDLETIIPYKVAKDIILKNPDHIALIDCPCRATVPIQYIFGWEEPFLTRNLRSDPNPEERSGPLSVCRSIEGGGYL